MSRYTGQVLDMAASGRMVEVARPDCTLVIMRKPEAGDDDD
jgi:hypothetical protein